MGTQYWKRPIKIIYLQAMTGPLWIALVYKNKHLRLASRRGVHWEPSSEIRACSEVKSLMAFVNSYDSDHFSIPQATVHTSYLQKATYLLHKQLLYWLPIFLVTNLRDKLSISNTIVRLLLQARSWQTHKTCYKSQKSHFPEPTAQHVLFPSDAYISFTKIPYGPNDIKKTTLVYGCHRSDPTKQLLEM